MIFALETYLEDCLFFVNSYFVLPYAPTTNLPKKRHQSTSATTLFETLTSGPLGRSPRRSDCKKCEWIWPPWKKKLHGNSSKSWNWRLRCVRFYRFPKEWACILLVNEQFAGWKIHHFGWYLPGKMGIFMGELLVFREGRVLGCGFFFFQKMDSSEKFWNFEGYLGWEFVFFFVFPWFGVLHLHLNAIFFLGGELFNSLWQSLLGSAGKPDQKQLWKYWEVQQKVIMFHHVILGPYPQCLWLLFPLIFLELHEFRVWTAQLPTISSSVVSTNSHGIPGSCGEWSGMVENSMRFQLKEISNILPWHLPPEVEVSVSFVYHLIEQFLVRENGWRALRRSLECALFLKKKRFLQCFMNEDCFSWIFLDDMTHHCVGHPGGTRHSSRTFSWCHWFSSLTASRQDEITIICQFVCCYFLLMG